MKCFISGYWSDEALRNLARRRGEAVVQGLAAAGAPAARINLGEATAVDTAGREVQVKLELGVAKK
jgi:hypothetical protein